MQDRISSKIKELEDVTEPFYKLKEIVRSGWVDKLSLENPETVASHTLLMIVLALYFMSSNHSYSDKKKLRLIEMILVHDLAETVIGDITPDSVKYRGKNHLENKAFEEIMDKVPPSTFKDRLNARWDQFNTKSSLEAQFVQIIDKLEMIMQGNYYLNNRKEVTLKQLRPFKDSTTMLLKNDANLPQESKPQNSSVIESVLNEIKEILAHLCK